MVVIQHVHAPFFNARFASVVCLQAYDHPPGRGRRHAPSSRHLRASLSACGRCSFGVLFSSCACVCRCRGCCSLSVCECVTCWSFYLQAYEILSDSDVRFVIERNHALLRTSQRNRRFPTVRERSSSLQLLARVGGVAPSVSPCLCPLSDVRSLCAPSGVSVSAPTQPPHPFRTHASFLS